MVRLNRAKVRIPRGHHVIVQRSGTVVVFGPNKKIERSIPAKVARRRGLVIVRKR